MRTAHDRAAARPVINVTTEVSAMGAMLYYFTCNDKTHGPLSASQMKQAAADGLIRPADIVWKAVGSAQIPARRVIGLFPTQVTAQISDAPAIVKPKAARSRKPNRMIFLCVATLLVIASGFSIRGILRLPRESTSSVHEHTATRQSTTSPSRAAPLAVSLATLESQKTNVTSQSDPSPSIGAPLPVSLASQKGQGPKLARSYAPYYLSEIRANGVFLVVEPTDDEKQRRLVGELGVSRARTQETIAQMLTNSGIRVFQDETSFKSEVLRIRRPILSLRITPSVVMFEGEVGFYSLRAEVGQAARIRPGTKMSPVANLRSWGPFSGIAPPNGFAEALYTELTSLLEEVIADINRSTSSNSNKEATPELFSDLQHSKVSLMEPGSFVRDVAHEGVVVRTVKLIAGVDDRRRLANLGFDPKLLRQGIEDGLKNAGFRLNAITKLTDLDDLDIRHEIIPSLQIHFKRLGPRTYIVLTASLALVEPVSIAQAPEERFRAALPIPGFSANITSIADDGPVNGSVSAALATLFETAREALTNGVDPSRAVPADNARREPVETWLEEDDFFPRRRYVANRVAGQIEGEARSYGESGGLCAADHFEHGVLQGLRTCFYPSGRKFMELTFRNGKSEGIGTLWFEDGTMAMTREYRAGIPHGTTVYYFRSGRPLIEAKVVDGQYQGARRHYLPSGELMGYSDWVDNKEVGRRPLRDPSQSDLADITAATVSPRLKDHWKARGKSDKPTEPGTKARVGSAPPKPKKTRRSRRDPANDAMRALFGR
jgi:hypothetical protein